MFSFILKYLKFHEALVYGEIDSKNTRLRFLLVVYFYGGICGLFAGISNLILGLGAIVTYSAFGMAILFLALHRSLFREWISFISGVRLFYFLAALYFNSLWFLNAGINGGILIFFYLLVIVIMIFSEGKERFFHLTMILSNIGVLFILNYFYEEKVIQYPSKWERFLDIYISVLISFVVNYIAINVVLTALKSSNKELDKKLGSIKKDLNLAKRIQMGIMTTPLKSESLDIATFYKPVEEVGGDLISIDAIDSDRIRFFIADATGHGVQAALVTMLILSEFQNLKYKTNSPAEILTALNAHFLKFYIDIRAIFTAVVLDWNLKEKSLLYSSAGHLPQLLWNGSSVIELPKTGPIIGLRKGSSYNEVSIPLKKDPLLFLYTDGLSEAFNDKKEMFGVEKTKSLLFSDLKLNSNSFLNLVRENLKSFTGEKSLDDDITLVVAQTKS